MLRRVVLLLTVLPLLIGICCTQSTKSTEENELIGRWGRLAIGSDLQDLAYSEFVLKSDGTYVLTGKEFGQDIKETGRWTCKDGILTLKIETASKLSSNKPGMIMVMNITRENGKLYAIAEPVWRWMKDVRWDFEKKAYFDEQGNRMEFTD